jgi:hypothetical protein
MIEIINARPKQSQFYQRAEEETVDTRAPKSISPPHNEGV